MQDINEKAITPSAEQAEKLNEFMESLVSGAAQAGSDRIDFGNIRNNSQPLLNNWSASGMPQNMGDLTPTNTATTQPNINAGAYNTMQNVNADNVYGSVQQAIQHTYDESDYSGGKRELQRYGALFGLGTASAHAQELHVAYKVFSDRDVTAHNGIGGISVQRDSTQVNRAKMHIDAELGEGKYRVMGNLSGNMLNDYRTNMNLLDSYLENHHINGKNLSESEIRGALKNGKLGSIDLSKEKGVKEVLEEKLFLKKHESLVKQAGSFGGGIKGTAKAWVKEAASDTDTYKGYQISKSIYAGAKATGWAVKGAMGAGANLAIGAGSGVLQIGSLVVRGGAGAVLKGQKFFVKTNNVKAEKLIENTKKFSTAVKTTSAKGYKVVNSLTKTSATDKLKWGWKKTGGRVTSKISAKFNPIRAQIGKAKMFIAKHTRIIRAPFTFASWINRMKKAIILGAAGFLLISCGFIVIIVSAISSVQGGSAKNIASIENGGIETSIGQEMIDYLWNYQKAYEELLQFGKTDVANHAGDCIPTGWNLSSVTVPMYSINEDGNVTYSQIVDNTNSLAEYTVYSGSRIKGYNLSDYDGPSTCVYKIPVYHFHEEEYQIVVDDPSDIVYHEKFLNGTLTEAEKKYITEKKWVRDEEPTMEYFVGYAGADGKDESGTPLVVSDYDISASKGNNSTTDVTFHYEGSNYSYQYTADKGARYTMSSGQRARYDIKALYKAFTSMAAVVYGGDNTDLDAYKKYGKTLFDNTMNNAQATVTVEYVPDVSKTVEFYYVDPDDPDHNEQLVSAPGYKAIIKTNVYLSSTGLMDVVNVDPYNDASIHNIGRNTDIYKVQDSSANDYLRWNGWDATETEGFTPLSQAIFYYEWADTDWTGFTGYKFPTETADILSEEEIEDFITQIRENNGGVLSDARERLIRAALGDVGRFYYKYGSGHPITDLENPPGGLDCSGWMSYVLYKGGADASYSARTASALASSYRGVSFGGNYAALQPGTILVKNADAGTLLTSTNHVVLFLGYAKLAGDSEVRPYCVECTTSGLDDGTRISGVMLSNASRVRNTIKNYTYARDPF